MCSRMKNMILVSVSAEATRQWMVHSKVNYDIIMQDL